MHLGDTAAQELLSSRPLPSAPQTDPREERSQSTELKTETLNRNKGDMRTWHPLQPCPAALQGLGARLKPPAGDRGI